jgi:Vitamin K-dependent gamma-carboxylase
VNTTSGAAQGSSVERILGRAWSAIDRFAFAPASAAPLAVLRIGLGTVLLAQALVVAPVLFEIAGNEGILQGPIRDALAERDLPRVGWLVSAFARIGVGEAPVLAGTGLVYVVALLALTAGFRTRAAAAVAWLTHLLLSTTADRAVYGADEFANVFLFYLVWMPSGATLSVDRVLGRAPADPSPLNRLAVRVAQIHLCIAYFMSGVEKALDHPWLTGDAMWRSLMLPEFHQLDFSWLANHAWLAKAGGFAVLAVEIGYPIFMWPRLTRRAWVAAAVALHLGIAVFMGLHVFGAIMVVFTMAVFGVPADPAPSTVACEPTVDSSFAPAKRGALRLLAVLGAIVLLGVALGMLNAAPEHGTVPASDLAAIEAPAPASEPALPAEPAPAAPAPEPGSPTDAPPPPELPGSEPLPTSSP